MLPVHIKTKKIKIGYNNSSGMTLAEVIIAMVLLSVLIVGMFTAMTNQTILLNRGKVVTVDAFSNQSEVEKAIDDLRNNVKFSDGSSSALTNTLNEYVIKPKRSDAITAEGFLTQPVDMYKMQLLDSKGNISRVYLSPSLASDEKYKNTLLVEKIELLINDDNTKDVALVSGTPDITGEYTIGDSKYYYTTIAKWYASIPGVIEPNWPGDYEQIERTVQEIKTKPITGKLSFDKSKLKNYANRYLVFTVQPVDGNGVRGAEAQSRSIFLQGVEWKDGNFAWADKNGNDTYDGFALDKDADIPYINVSSLLDYNNLVVSSSDVSSMDIKNSSLFVPRALTEGKNKYSGNIYPNVNTGNKYEKDIVASDPIAWKVQNSIHFSNKIISDLPVSIRTDDGQIVMYRFIVLDKNGKAKLASGVPVLKDPGTFDFKKAYSGTPRLYQNIGSEISTLSSIYMGAYGSGKGFIYLQPISSINGANIALEAEESITMYNSALTLQTLSGDTDTMSREIKLSSIKGISIRSYTGFTPNYIKGNPLTKSSIVFDTNQNIFVENALFEDININLLGEAALKGVGWDANSTLTVKDGTVLSLEKSGSKEIDNEGSLNLGNTGGVKFVNSMSEDLKKPLKLTLTASGTQFTIGSNYGRNIGLADAGSSSFVNGIYQDLGSGNTNLEYKISVDDIDKVSNIEVHFDGNETLTVTGTVSDPTASVVANLTIRDKYVMDSDNMPIEIATPVRITLN